MNFNKENSFPQGQVNHNLNLNSRSFTTENDLWKDLIKSQTRKKSISLVKNMLDCKFMQKEGAVSLSLIANDKTKVDFDLSNEQSKALFGNSGADLEIVSKFDPNDDSWSGIIEVFEKEQQIINVSLLIGGVWENKLWQCKIDLTPFLHLNNCQLSNFLTSYANKANVERVKNTLISIQSNVDWEVEELFFNGQIRQTIATATMKNQRYELNFPLWIGESIIAN